MLKFIDKICGWYEKQNSFTRFICWILYIQAGFIPIGIVLELNWAIISIPIFFIILIYAVLYILYRYSEHSLFKK